MYDAPGARVEKVAVRAFNSGSAVVVDNQVGFGVKVAQLDRFTAPDSDEAVEVAVGETFTLFVKGVHELACEGDLASLESGDLLYIDSGDDTVQLADYDGDAEVQVLTIDATGGTFTLTYDGETTGAIAEAATAAAVQTALEGLSNITPGDVAVTGSAGGPYTITFAGEGNKVTITTGAGSLTGGAGTAVITTTTPGTSGDSVLPLGVVQQIDDSRTPAVARINIDTLHAFLAA